MSYNTSIEWTQSTWNPFIGCSHVSPGCDHCYAERMAGRLAAMGQRVYKDVLDAPTLDYGPTSTWTGTTKLIEKALDMPFHWRKPRHIFVNSMSDTFHASVPFDWIDKIFAIMACCPQHTFKVLTKRPKRMAKWMDVAYERVCWKMKQPDWVSLPGRYFPHYAALWPLQNVWPGVTVESSDYLLRIDILRRIPAVKRFVSFEPLLGDVGAVNLNGIDWVICGGETGPGARPMHQDWVRSIRDQCQGAGVPFFFKQWGTWCQYEQSTGFQDSEFIEPEHCRAIYGDMYYRCKPGEKATQIDGREWKEITE